MDWSIQEISRIAGTTSRTLRHYDEVGSLAPSRVAANGYRHYDQEALTRLQRILLLRDLGLGIAAIQQLFADQDAGACDGPGELAEQTSRVAALRTHLTWLSSERERLDRQIASVEKTIEA